MRYYKDWCFTVLPITFKAHWDYYYGSFKYDEILSLKFKDVFVRKVLTSKIIITYNNKRKLKKKPNSVNKFFHFYFIIIIFFEWKNVHSLIRKHNLVKASLWHYISNTAFYDCRVLKHRNEIPTTLYLYNSLVDNVLLSKLLVNRLDI